MASDRRQEKLDGHWNPYPPGVYHLKCMQILAKAQNVDMDMDMIIGRQKSNSGLS